MTLASSLEAVAACGGVGGFLDFVLGKAGQRKAKDWVETNWLKLSYVEFKAFGKTEATFTSYVLSKLLGRKFISIHRLAACLTISILVFLWFFACYYIYTGKTAWFRVSDAVYLFLSSLMLSFSISVIFANLKIVCALSGQHASLNAVIFSTMLLFQYVYLCQWSQFSSDCFDPICETYHCYCCRFPAHITKSSIAVHRYGFG